MADEVPQSLWKVIGANARRLRESDSLTQDELGTLGRRHGLDFSRSTVAALERGARMLDLGEVALLCFVLGCSLSDLLGGAGLVALSKQASIDASALPLLIADGPGGLKQGAIRTPGLDEAYDALAAARGRYKVEEKRIRRRWPGATPAEIVRAESGGRGDPETKAARKVGARPFDVSMAALRLWDMSLTERRDSIVAGRITKDTPVRSVQAIRGRVTRDLIDEIRPLLPKGK
jgi:transcriptional regulator with XRE-family HTH domain